MEIIQTGFCVVTLLAMFEGELVEGILEFKSDVTEYSLVMLIITGMISKIMATTKRNILKHLILKIQRINRFLSQAPSLMPSSDRLI